jgi:phosphatidylglycerol:prolipoprotein diacylglycerol transferase
MIDGFPLGPLYIRFYGIILMTGAFAGGWLATREAKRHDYDPEIIWDLLIYLVIGGVIGARLWHVFTPSPSALVMDTVTGEMVNPYFAGGTIHILDILLIWKGGLGIPGAVIGGAIALYYYTRNNKLNFLEWADIAAPSLALGQAIGRFGNFFNQELYGAPTDLPWKLYIDPQHRLPGFASVEYYHPLFAYEAILNFANMFLLMWATREYAGRSKKGDILLAYLVFYPLVRFSLDFLRLDASTLGGININQTIMGIIALIALGTLIWRHRPGAPSEPADDPEPAEKIEVVAAAAEPVARKKTIRKTTTKKITAQEPAQKKRIVKKSPPKVTDE